MASAKTVKIKDIVIGKGNKIAIQSMTNTKTDDFEATLAQIMQLQAAGCDIVRLAVCCAPDISTIKKLVLDTNIPLVADIQFDYRLAISSVEAGIHKIRFNPANIGSDDKLNALIVCCKRHNIPIRIGLNGGSLVKSGQASADMLVDDALKNIKILEKAGFYDIVISVKSSNVVTTIDAYKKLAQLVDYPLHLGVTESGTSKYGIIKSSIGIGSLLAQGIGDTIRVSLTGNPINEIYAAKNILRALNIDNEYVEIISCPTCSRCNYDLEKLVLQIEDYTKNIELPLKIAIMGCVVNGPGEAKNADFGIAGGASDGKGALFEKGKVVKTIDMSNAYQELTALIDKHTKNNTQSL